MVDECFFPHARTQITSLFDFRACTAMASDPTTAEGGSPIEIDDSTDEHHTTEVKFVFNIVSYSSVENAVHACRNLHSKDSVSTSSAWYLTDVIEDRHNGSFRLQCATCKVSCSRSNPANAQAK
jgi:hypothetical protein